jgi:cytochrome P450
MCVEGVTVPAGTQLVAFGAAINRDPHVFADPDEFKPERFLNDSGQFAGSDNFLFFGVGKRRWNWLKCLIFQSVHQTVRTYITYRTYFSSLRCPGEALGRADVLLFSLNLLRHFRFSVDDRDKIDCSPLPGITFRPKPFEVVLEVR